MANYIMEHKVDLLMSDEEIDLLFLLLRHTWVLGQQITMEKKY